MFSSCKTDVLILWEWLIKAIDSYFSNFNLLYRILDVVTTLYSYLLVFYLYKLFPQALTAAGTQSMVQMAFLELPLEPTKFEVDPATTGTN